MSPKATHAVCCPHNIWRGRLRNLRTRSAFFHACSQWASRWASQASYCLCQDKRLIAGCRGGMGMPNVHGAAPLDAGREVVARRQRLVTSQVCPTAHGTEEWDGSWEHRPKAGTPRAPRALQFRGGRRGAAKMKAKRWPCRRRPGPESTHPAHADNPCYLMLIQVSGLHAAQEKPSRPHLTAQMMHSEKVRHQDSTHGWLVLRAH